tara:strand:+ start:267 stop:650 length:384 start_codon:yes stop_codon:yes gene_type:complete
MALPPEHQQDDAQRNDWRQGNSGNSDPAKTTALVAYLCLIAGYFTGIFWLIGGIWIIVKRSDFNGHPLLGHFDNIISVFWWGMGLSVIGVALAPVIVGYFILLGVFVWSVFRIIKGLALLTSDKPYP